MPPPEPARIGDPPPSRRRFESLALGLLLLAAAWLYFWWARQPGYPWITKQPAGFYPMLTDAFRHGRLHLAIEPDPALARLADPYDPEQNRPYQVNDLSYFRGHYFLYFGAAPVVTLLLPWTALTGMFLTEPFAVAFFAAASLGVALLLLGAVRRRHWPAVPTAYVLLAGAVLAVGNNSFFLLRYPDYWQIAMACAWFWQVAALACGYRALNAERWTLLWLALASAAAGLSVAARPSYLLGTLLLVPVAWSVARRPRRILPVLLAAGGPIAAVGVGLMAYNFRRFGSPFEFGMRYQFIGVDLRHQPLLTPAAFGRNLAAYLFHVPRFQRYFPFLFDPPESTPVGALLFLPFSWLAGLLPVWRRFARRPAGDGSGPLLLASALAAGGNFTLLCFYFLVWGRHAFDLILPLTWLAALGLLAGADALRAHPGARRVFAVITPILVAGSVGMSFFIGARAFQAPEKLAAAARLFDEPVHWFEALRGQRFGPLQFDVVFPVTRAGLAEPLLCTGTEQRDLLYVRYLDDAHLQFGFFHEGLGGPLSDPFAITPGGVHHLEVEWGALCPPPEHPVFAGWPPATVHHARMRLGVWLDGRELLAQEAMFHPSTPGAVQIGRTPNAFGFCAAEFSGRILRRQQLALAPAPPLLAPNLSGGCVLDFSLGLRRTGYSEPLLATGRGSASDLLLIQFLPNNQVRFGLDHWGGAAVFSRAIGLPDDASRHRLAVFLPPLAAATPTGVGSRLLIFCDDELLLDAPGAFHPAGPDDVYLGTNPFGASSAQPMFSGRIIAVRAATPEIRSGREATLPNGPVSLLVRFPTDAPGRSDPLLVTGRTGAGDLLYVRYLDARRVQFGFDHWGVGGIVGPPVALPPGGAHRLILTMGSLYPAAPGRPALVRVTLDGATVLWGESPCHPARPERVFIGENPIGGSTCGTEFTGRIFLVERGTLPVPQKVAPGLGGPGA